MSNNSEEQWVSWMDELAEKDYVIIDDFISEELYRCIMTSFRSLEKEEKLRKAGIGALGEFKIEKEIRGDFIYWLDKDRDQIMAPFFELMEEVKEKLKRYCFISLSGSEFHLAKYPAGSFYHRHLDQFNNRNNRQITILIYQNDAWKKGDGGELRIFKEGEESVLVEPVARRLLLFKSDSVEHEVLTTNVTRYSLTGWLLRQPASLGYLLG
tara:strand:- start:24816 stop:25448 length:633 start_codon:yes stop_codon:yes gene_type:complete